MLAEYNRDGVFWDYSDDEAPGIPRLFQVEKAGNRAWSAQGGQVQEIPAFREIFT